MKFKNKTSYQADALWGSDGPRGMGAAVIVKGTYELGQGGRLSQTQDAPWPVHFDNIESPYGLFLSEYTPYRKPKVDLILCGRARSPRQRPVEQMDLTASVGGAFRFHLKVFGDRRWERRDRGLTPSRPEPFYEMPLTLDRAFGGRCAVEWGELLCSSNPQGRGWYPEEALAEGNPLPNLEDPADLISRWDDRPQPVAPGPFPLDAGLRWELLPRERTNPLEWDHLMHNWAHPRLMLDRPPPVGERLLVEGLSHEGPLEATLPPCEARAHVRCGTDVHPMDLSLDTVIVLGEERRVVFRWRGGARFAIHPRERREILLTPARQRRRR